MFTFNILQHHHSDQSGCNVLIYANETLQYFATQHYPSSYLDNQDCSFTFVAPPGDVVVVTFDHVDIELDYDFILLRKYLFYIFEWKMFNSV